MRAREIAILFTIGALLVPEFVAGQKKEEGAENGQVTIRANVEMVSLPVVVSDRMGRRIIDLSKKDFRVFEDGVEQEIAGFAATDEPLAIALLLDTSGSTQFKLARIQDAAIDFVNQLHPDDEVAVLSFADDVKLQQEFTIDRDRNEYGIKKTRTGEWTVAYEAVWLALEEVLKPKPERTALVVFSDGVDTRSRKATEKETLELARETRATIYSVYYDTEGDQYKQRSPIGYPTRLPPIIGTGPVYTPSGPYPQLRPGKDYLEKLAEYSGGLTFDGNEDLRYAFSEVAKELASQYSIGYYSTNQKRDGKFRKVEVRLNKPGLVARTKKGYYTKKENKK